MLHEEFIYLFIYLFVYLFIYLFIYLFVYCPLSKRIYLATFSLFTGFLFYGQQYASGGK